MTARLSVAVALVAGVALLCPRTAECEWIDVGTPENGWDANASWLDSDGLYVAWQGFTAPIGLWRYDRMIDTWTPVGLDACDPGTLSGCQPHTLIAGCTSDRSDARSWSSFDAGANWWPGGEGVSGAPVVLEAQDAPEASLMLVGQATEPKQIYRSSDLGTSWELEFDLGPAGNLRWRDLAIDRANPEHALAAGVIDCGLPFFETTDGGRTWAQIQGPVVAGHEYFTRILVSPARPGEFYVLAGDHLFRRVPEGWGRIRLPLSHAWDLALLSPHDPHLLVIGGYSTETNLPVVMRTSDFEAIPVIWEDLSEGLPADLRTRFGHAELYEAEDGSLFLVDRAGYVGLWPSPASADPAGDRTGGLRVFPNPSSGAVEFRLDPGAGSFTTAPTLLLTDVAGRQISAVAPILIDRGARYVWDGRDVAGHPVPAGVYFARVGEDRASRVRFVRSE